MADRPTLLVVGAAARDIDHSDPRGWRLGGTVAYASLAAARLGVHVRALVGTDEHAATADELDILRTAGVDLRTVPIEHGPVFDNRQTSDGRVQIVHQASDRVPAAALPDKWRSSSAVLLGTVAGELGDDWADRFDGGSFVALAWQGLLRRIQPGFPVEAFPPRRTALVTRADALLVSSEDVDGDVRIDDLMGDNQLLLSTHGARGVIELRRDQGRVRARSAPALSPPTVVDPTGAGDVFAGAWLSARLLAPEAPTDRHLLVASAMAGLSVRAKGLAAMPSKRDLCEAVIKLEDGNRWPRAPRTDR